MYGSLQPEENNSTFEVTFGDVEKRRPSWSVQLVRFTVLSVVVALLTFAAVNIVQHPQSTSADTTTASSSSASSEASADSVQCQETSISLKAINEYGEFTAPYPFLANGELLIEPYKSTTISVSGIYASTSGYKFLWDFLGDKSHYEGHHITVSMQTTGNFVFKLKVHDSDGNYVCEYDNNYYVKYVKREMRSLTEDDRSKFLNAAAELWNYETGEGRKKYGADFVGIATFVESHSLASNDIMCDQFHEGTGFLTHHLALGNSFEASMRSVDPTIILPYWDFSIEGQKITDADEVPSYMMEVTDVFTHKYFGSVDEENHIQDGRWAHSEMPMAKTNSSTRNSYGYIRSYWNNNPDPEVSRKLFYACGMEPTHKTIPNCQIHYDVLNADTLGMLQLLSPADGHGPMHVQTGGMWGACEDWYHNFTEKYQEALDRNVTADELVDMGYSDGKWKFGYEAPGRVMFEKAIMGEYFHIYRSLWRSHMCSANGDLNLLVCPDTCDLSTPIEECECTVPSIESGEMGWEDIAGCVLNDENLSLFKSWFSDEFLEDMVTGIATSNVMEGEMIESASTADILFWMIHPAIERLVQAKRLDGVSTMGSAEFSKWSPADGSEETWLEYSYYSFDKETMYWHPDAYTCYGHGADDAVMPHSLPLSATVRHSADLNDDMVISNWEFYLALNPNDPTLNDYVFDNFDWEHCDDVKIK